MNTKKTRDVVYRIEHIVATLLIVEAVLIVVLCYLYSGINASVKASSVTANAAYGQVMKNQVEIYSILRTTQFLEKTAKDNLGITETSKPTPPE